MITFFVPGVPVQQGSLKGRVAMTPKGPRAIIYGDNNATLKDWRATVRQEAASHLTSVFDVPVRVGVRFYMPRPASVKRVWPAVIPDLDKLLRGVLDALTGTAYLDDKLVVSLGPVLDKVYAAPGAPSGARIWIEEAGSPIALGLALGDLDAKVGLLG